MPLESADRRKIMANFTDYVRKVADLEYLNKTEVIFFSIFPPELIRKSFQTTVEQRKIAANSTGHSYARIFGKCCDDRLRMVHVQDAYISAHHQLVNFVRFCELVVPLSVNLLVITLRTGEEARKNQAEFEELSKWGKFAGKIRKFCDFRSLAKRGVMFNVEFSTTIHDREIMYRFELIYPPEMCSNLLKNSINGRIFVKISGFDHFSAWQRSEVHFYLIIQSLLHILVVYL